MSKKSVYLNAYFKERRVTTFLPPKYQRLVTGYSYDKGCTKSTAITGMIKNHFESISEAERRRYLDIYEKMSPEERKKPNKNSE